MVVEVQTWVQARQWWVALPPGTLQKWQTSASNFVVSASPKHQASRVEHLLSAAIQPTCELVPTTGSSGSGSRPGSQGGGKAEASASQGTERTPTQQVDFFCVWRAPVKRGAYAHACKGALPLCKQKKQCGTAHFKGDMVTFTNLEHAKQVRPVCPTCSRLVVDLEAETKRGPCVVTAW